jgi:CTP synthase
VQVVPHITDEIKRNVKLLGTKHKYDFVITEIGGTVGDIESLPFIESVRQLRWELGKNCLCIHLTYVPYLAATKELKTKPTQHSVKQLQELGIQPDILVLRTEHELSAEVRRKVALFCNVEPNAVIQSIDVPSIYEVPVKMQEQGLDVVALNKMGIPVNDEVSLGPWKEFLARMSSATEVVKIGLVGKYVELPDAYKSINESLLQAATYNDHKLKITYFHSEKLNDSNAKEQLEGMDGLLIAPGFGQRGIDGKFAALKYARENDVPTLGICLGMQCMVIEFARNLLGFENANSTEMDTKTPYNVIDLMEEQKGIINLGGTMRLGAYDCTLEEKSTAAKAYGSVHIQERHRHRFEFNNKYKDSFEKAGMQCVGHNPDTGLVEVVEIPTLKWYVGVQYHPEYNSTVLRPNPLFLAFVNAAIKNK